MCDALFFVAVFVLRSVVWTRNLMCQVALVPL